MDVKKRITDLFDRGNKFTYNSFATHSSNGYPEALKPDYVAWKTEVAAFLNRLCGPDHPIYAQFMEGADEEKTPVIGWGEDRFQMAQGYILGALTAALATFDAGELEDPTVAQSPVEAIHAVRKVCERFHQVAVTLRRKRYSQRPTLNVADEYDVQDLLHALLKVEFSDVRPEEHTPSYAGGSSRMDFLIKGTGIVVEVKKTRAGLADRELGEQLIVDIGRYRSHPECRVLVCFVYDPEELVVNPDGLIHDLQANAYNDLKVEVIISPTRG